jgi:arylsulfatase A-like enzyme
LPTIPVRTSLFTGRYTLPFRRWQPLEKDDVVIAEVLWNQGFRSALVADTYHMHKPQMAFGRGFDNVSWIRGQETDPYITDPGLETDVQQFSPKDWRAAYPGQSDEAAREKLAQYLKNIHQWKGEEDHFVAQVMTKASSWLEEQVESGRRDRLFLWIDSFDPHEPWDPPSPYREMYQVEEYDGPPIIWAGGSSDDWTLSELRHYRAQYSGEVSLVDHWVGTLLRKVEDLGMMDNTMIVILSDHGEPLGEHGIVKKVRPWPYEELSHFPLIIRMPDGSGYDPGRIDKFVGMPDVMPTILEFLEVEKPETIQGRSLLGVASGEIEPPVFGISGHYGRSWSIRNVEWSFYLWPGGKAPYTWGIGYPKPSEGERNPELYLIDRGMIPPLPSEYDPETHVAEKDNVIGEHPEIARSMELDLRRFIQTLTPSPGDIMAQESMATEMRQPWLYGIVKK